jgi:hypothetical protein
MPQIGSAVTARSNLHERERPNVAPRVRRVVVLLDRDRERRSRRRSSRSAGSDRRSDRRGSVAVEAGMRGVVVVDRRAPLKSTSCIAQSSAPSVSPSVRVPRSPEMKIATPRRRWPTACCVLVEVDRRAEGGAVVGRAGHGEGDVDVLNELVVSSALPVAALDTHLCRTAQRDVGGCYASSCHKGSRSEENLFHGFSLVFTLKVHLKTDIRIEYASLSLVGPGIARKARAVAQLAGLVVQTCHTDSRGLTPLARNEKRAGRGPLFGFGGMPQAQKEKESPRE